MQTVANDEIAADASDVKLLEIGLKPGMPGQAYTCKLLKLKNITKTRKYENNKKHETILKNSNKH